MKVFNLDKKIIFPNHLFEKKIDEFYIIIATEKPNWIVLKKNEYDLFALLKFSNSIREALELYYEKYCQNENECLDILTKILSQIDKVNFLEEAKSKQEKKIELIKKLVHINTTNNCNMRCKHCYMSAGLKKISNINFKSLKETINKLRKKYGKLDIVISGGEPLTYPHIYELLKFLKKDKVLLFTNGALINEKNINIIANYCNEVQISFEGLTKESYELVRGKDNYKKVLNAIKLLKEYNMRIVLAITILPFNLENIENNLIKFVRNLNYKNIEVRLNDDIEIEGNAKTLDMSLYNQEKSHNTIIKLTKKLKEMGCNVQKEEGRNIRFTNCGIGTNLVINYDGKIYPCSKFANFYNSITDNIDDIILRFDKINKETSNIQILKCQKCELKYICSGGCRINNLIKNGNMLDIICDDKFKENKYRKIIYDFKMYIEE